MITINYINIIKYIIVTTGVASETDSIDINVKALMILDHIVCRLPAVVQRDRKRIFGRQSIAFFNQNVVLTILFLQIIWTTTKKNREKRWLITRPRRLWCLEIGIDRWESDRIRELNRAKIRRHDSRRGQATVSLASSCLLVCRHESVSSHPYHLQLHSQFQHLIQFCCQLKIFQANWKYFSDSQCEACRQWSSSILPFYCCCCKMIQLVINNK